VVAVYLERAGHGGESAAPVARQIYEAIFGIDRRTQVRLAKDGSG
jgi:cell division protein FtsI/penicillin-binding protein 2